MRARTEAAVYFACQRFFFFSHSSQPFRSYCISPKTRRISLGGQARYPSLLQAILSRNSPQIWQKQSACFSSRETSTRAIISQVRRSFGGLFPFYSSLVFLNR